MNRDNLPFRKNCEGYFFDNKGNVLAKYENYLYFPGGGIEKGETPESAVLRETKEETGAVIKNLRKLRVLKFVWGKNWAVTEKQKLRYTHYQGEEMHFFSGIIEKFEGEDEWKGQKLMPVKKVIELIEKEKPFDKDIAEYREAQISFLRKSHSGFSGI